MTSIYKRILTIIALALSSPLLGAASSSASASTPTATPPWEESSMELMRYDIRDLNSLYGGIKQFNTIASPDWKEQLNLIGFKERIASFLERISTPTVSWTEWWQATEGPNSRNRLYDLKASVQFITTAAETLRDNFLFQELKAGWENTWKQLIQDKSKEYRMIPMNDNFYQNLVGIPDNVGRSFSAQQMRNKIDEQIALLRTSKDSDAKSILRVLQLPNLRRILENGPSKIEYDMYLLSKKPVWAEWQTKDVGPALDIREATSRMGLMDSFITTLYDLQAKIGQIIEETRPE